MEIYMTWFDNNGVLWDRFRKDRKAEGKFGFSDSVPAGIMSGGRRERGFFDITMKGGRKRKKRKKRKTRKTRRTKRTKRDEGSPQGSPCSMLWSTLGTAE